MSVSVRLVIFVEIVVQVIINAKHAIFVDNASKIQTVLIIYIQSAKIKNVFMNVKLIRNAQIIQSQGVTTENVMLNVEIILIAKI